jgi:arylsulfatase A-like enzyme
MDLYPTLMALTGTTPPPHLEGGQSLVPVLRNPAMTSDRPVLTTFGLNNHSLRDMRYRYIRYADGSEELYDHSADPNEWHNLAGRPDTAAIKSRLARFLPSVNTPSPLPPGARATGAGGRGGRAGGRGAAPAAPAPEN